MTRQIIIGGGALGLSVACHLAERGSQDILLLERNQLMSGASWHAAGIVGPLRATPNMTQLALYACELFPRLESITGLSTGYRQTGGYWLARQPERMDELHRIAALGQHLGLAAEIVNTQTVMDSVPCLNLNGHAGAMSVAEDASVNPVDLCLAYARAAKDKGVVIRENSTVSDIMVANGVATGVQLEDGTTIAADTVILCAGAWSKPLARRAGLELPLQAVEHMYVVTEPLAGNNRPFPVVRDLDTGIYIKGDSGNKLIIGGFEPDAKCWDAFSAQGDRPFLELPEDWEQFQPFMQAALDLIPGLENTGIQRFMNGPESFTADTRPLVGEAPEVDGLYVAAGMNSVGIMSSAGIGRALADWITDGYPPMDLWEVDIARIDPATASDAHMRQRMRESVSDLFAMHWPYKQPVAGRGLRKSCLHDYWAAQGAVFGLTAGWERGLWYAKEQSGREFNYSVGVQPWHKIAQQEAAELCDGVCLVDLSPLSKFELSGADACVFLQQLVCSNCDIAIGSTVYTQVLNDRGGIEADITITRFSETRFRLSSGAASRWRDKQLLRKRSRNYTVTIDDVTEDEAVIGVMGGGATRLLAQLSDTDWSQFAFSTSQLVQIVGISVRATRLSFVGECGWEFNIPCDKAGDLFEAFIGAGAKPLGHYAVDACRMEKGYRHWGHDTGPQISPLVAGLGFTIDWHKEFTGKQALLDERGKGCSQRLCLFEVSGDPLILHDEPILEAGRVIGLTTSGAKGVRVSKTLAFGLVNIASGESSAQTQQRKFEIKVAGACYPATVLLNPPYDPTGERMRP
ncbi:oxidoreductase [Chromatiales bacterium (ex Bugula neritina AB1)]|nr:oxidoreductase [Chromatiales bacterium (ex Bugula neritina AB1)]